MFKITIETSNDAFQDDCRYEIARILEDLTQKIYQGKEPSILLDTNGNIVGEVFWAI